MKLSVFIITLILIAIVSNAQTTNITQFSTLIKPNHNISLVNSLWDDGCLMTYDPNDVATKGGAFSLNFVNPGGTGYKGYPNASIGAHKNGSNYTQGVPAACGLPVKIADLTHDLRMQWKVSQANANDVDDKWWASINVIFDNGAPNVAPVQADRDFDIVIELNRYKQEDFDDVAIAPNDSYWYYARNTDNSLKTVDFNYNGTVYSWVVRYKFSNYDPGHNNYDENNKVHVKFTPLYNNSVAPFLDHSLKKFIDVSKDYLQYVNLTPAERTLANEKVANPNTYIKNVNAGYEVYTGSFTINNDYYHLVKDVTAPAAPVNLLATKVANDIVLNWSDNAESDFNTYQVYRSINGGPYTLYQDNVNVSNYTDANVTDGQTYNYYVVANDRSYNVSAQSNIQSVFNGVLSLLPDAVTPNRPVANPLVAIFPNPTVSGFEIKSPNRIWRVTMYTTDGKQVALRSNGNQYSLVNHKAGVYVVKIETGYIVVYKKVVVQ